MNTFTVFLVGLVCLYFYALSGVAFCRLLPECHKSKWPKLICFLFWPIMLPLSAGHKFDRARMPHRDWVRRADIQSGKDE